MEGSEESAVAQNLPRCGAVCVCGPKDGGDDERPDVLRAGPEIAFHGQTPAFGSPPTGAKSLLGIRVAGSLVGGLFLWGWVR